MKLHLPTAIEEIVSQYFKLLAAMVVIIICVIGWVLLLSPKYQKIQQTGGLTYKQSGTELTDAENYLAQLKDLQKTYETLNHEDLADLEKILPEKKDIPGLLIQLEALTKDNGLVMTNIDISEPEENVAPVTDTNQSLENEFSNQNIRSLDITMSVQGIDSYNKLKVFLQEIEKNIRIVDLKAFQYQEGQQVYALNLGTYYLEQQ